MSFLDELQKQTNTKLTENGAVTNKSTLNPLLDFFSMAGAMRGKPFDALKLFKPAYAEDKQTALRTLFYLRDVRGGQGERALFRSLMDYVAGDPDTFSLVAQYIPTFGRWDDLLALYYQAPVVIGGIIRNQLALDEEAMKAGNSVSLLAKWLPSENASSKKSAKLAGHLAAFLGLKPSQYRKKVVALRKHIDLLEQKMSAQEWPAIDYSKLPSQAQRKHVKAFKRHDEERYTAYLEAAQKGEAKMNTSTLYTYEVFDAVREGKTDAANAMWANLPDWTNGNNALVVADVSGSMAGRPMSVSVSLALYFAEHNKGQFHNCFMTFSSNPQVVRLPERGTLTTKLNTIQSADWAMSTNLEAVFDAILRAARAAGTGAEDLPRLVYIISDMEFDQAVSDPNASIFNNAKKAYEAAGYTLPHLVFWNVNARQVQAPATKFDNRVTLISGLSQSTFRYAVEGKTPEELMYEVVNSERYAIIEV